MTCPKCQSQNAQPFERWTISGRKITIPLLRMWACPNPDCRHQWPREFPARPDLPVPFKETPSDALIRPTSETDMPSAPPPLRVAQRPRRAS